MTRLTSKFTVLIFTLVFCVIAVTAYVAHKQRNASTHLLQSREASIPQGWKKIEIAVLTFYAPPNISQRNVQGTDTSVWEFHNSEINLRIEYGPFASTLPAIKKLNYREEKVDIDGVNANVVFFGLDDSNAYDFSNEGFRQVAGIIRLKPPSNGFDNNSMTIIASYSDSRDEETVKRIIGTIKFKQIP